MIKSEARTLNVLLALTFALASDVPSCGITYDHHSDNYRCHLQPYVCKTDHWCVLFTEEAYD
jgi:hypothetical protein